MLEVKTTGYHSYMATGLKCSEAVASHTTQKYLPLGTTNMPQSNCRWQKAYHFVTQYFPNHKHTKATVLHKLYGAVVPLSSYSHFIQLNLYPHIVLAKPFVCCYGSQIFIYSQLDRTLPIIIIILRYNRFAVFL